MAVLPGSAWMPPRTGASSPGCRRVHARPRLDAAAYGHVLAAVPTGLGASSRRCLMLSSLAPSRARRACRLGRQRFVLLVRVVHFFRLCSTSATGFSDTSSWKNTHCRASSSGSDDAAADSTATSTSRSRSTCAAVAHGAHDIARLRQQQLMPTRCLY